MPIELLKKELALMKKLLDLTQKCPQAVEGGDFSPLPGFFSQRAGVLEEISRCRSSRGKGQFISPRHPEAKEAFRVIAEIKAVHQEIVALDRTMGRRLGEEKDRIWQKMQQIRHGQQTLKGYSSHRVPIPRYCDKKG